MIIQRLDFMSRAIDDIENSLPATFDLFDSAEYDIVRTALEHRLFVAIQAAIDIAAHVAVVTSVEFPGSYKDAMIALGRAKVLSPQLAEQMAEAAGLRNVIAHGYLDIDNRRLFEALHQTAVLKDFAVEVWAWTEGQ